ncbi:MAG TPA: hypothetical protein ENI14_03890 [Thermoplasmatales archaeon]|nr:hypothetical protein [Thermoplasmatales archaeon]
MVIELYHDLAKIKSFYYLFLSSVVDMKEFPLVYVKNGKIIDENGRKIVDWKEKVDKFAEIYIMDLDGIERNEPNLDFYQSIYKKKWIDAVPRRFEDVMDLVVAGGNKIVIREGFDDRDIDRIFSEVDVELYLSLSKDCSLKPYNWNGFVYLLNEKMGFEVKEFLSELSNVFIIARRKEYIDFDWADENKIDGVAYPLWEMEA